MNETGKYVPKEAKEYKFCEDCFKPENVEGFGDTTDENNEMAKEAFKNGWLEKVVIKDETMVVYTDKYYKEFVKEKEKNRPIVQKAIQEVRQVVMDKFLKKNGYSKKNNGDEKNKERSNISLETEKEGIKDQIKNILIEKGIKFKDIKIKAGKNRKKGGEVLYEVKIVGLDNSTHGVDEIFYNNKTEEDILQAIDRSFPSRA